VGRAASALLIAAAALAAQAPLRFTLGDSRERVRQVQGNPEVIERLASLNTEVWNYGASFVAFDPRTGHVVAFVNRDRRLKVAMTTRPAAAPRPGHTSAVVAMGATRDDVVRSYGTPWAYTRDAGAGHEFLAFGRSIVRVDARTLQVNGWIVRDSSIRVDPGQRVAGEVAMSVRSDGRAASDVVAPATLRGTVRSSDDDGDGRLAPGEAATVVVTLANDGPGIARAVRPALRVESPATGVEVTASPAGEEIRAGERRDFTFRLRAEGTQGANEVVIVVAATEANGFDLAPSLRFRIAARPAGAPRLVVESIRVDDASRDGRLAPRELGDLSLRVANVGDVASLPLRARLWRGADLFLAAGARDTFSLGPIAPGSDAGISLSVYTNSRAANTSLHLELADPTGRVVARLPIPLPVTGAASGVLDVAYESDTSTEMTAGRSASGGAPSVDPSRDIRPAASRRPDAVAVVLGVERYKSLPDARYAARDAELMRRYVVEVLGVSDDVEHLHVRTDADVTGGELRKLFGESGWLARRVTANTDLVLYFAGHGAPDAAGRAPYLLPYDADPSFVAETGMALGSVYDRLARLPARSITVLLDACFSGLTRGAQALVPGTRPTILSIEHPALIRRQMAVLSAARDAQVAGDLPEARHGLFTYWVARGLRGEADANSDDVISIAELGRFAEGRVRQTAARLNRDQRPLLVARDSLIPIARLAPGK